MLRSHTRKTTPLKLVLFGMLLPVSLIALSVWRIDARTPQDAQEALSDGRTVSVLLPSGTVQGGVRANPLPPPMSESLPPARVMPPDAPPESQAMALLTPAPGEGLNPVTEALSEATPAGALPIVGADGVKPWQYYAREFTKSGDAPMVAVVITGLGLSKQTTDMALRLPPAFSLSFSPYAADAAVWAGAARALGHEVLVDWPMEPEGYPAADPGPHAALTSQTPEVNEQKLRWVLSRFQGHIGVMAAPGERFTADRDALQPLAQFLNTRGMLLVLSNPETAHPTQVMLTQIAAPHLLPQDRLEAEGGHEKIVTQLLSLEALARKQGAAFLIAPASPATMRELSVWAEALGKKGIILAPVSALARLKFS